MAAKDPVVRSLSAKIAANKRWGSPGADGAAQARIAAAGRLRQFEQQADPDGVLKPAARRKKALALRRAHMQGLALKSRAKRAAA